MRRARIYIAGPITKGDKIDNLSQALKAFRCLAAMGYAPMCPQLSMFTEPFFKLEHNDWLEIDLPWVECADALLRLPGASLGADIETRHAGRHVVPVFGSIDDLTQRVPARLED